jgi:hypothetical protein
MVTGSFFTVSLGVCGSFWKLGRPSMYVSSGKIPSRMLICITLHQNTCYRRDLSDLDSVDADTEDADTEVEVTEGDEARRRCLRKIDDLSAVKALAILSLRDGFHDSTLIS